MDLVFEPRRLVRVRERGTPLRLAFFALILAIVPVIAGSLARGRQGSDFWLPIAVGFVAEVFFLIKASDLVRLPRRVEIDWSASVVRFGVFLPAKVPFDAIVDVQVRERTIHHRPEGHRRLEYGVDRVVGELILRVRWFGFIRSLLLVRTDEKERLGPGARELDDKATRLALTLGVACRKPSE